MVFLILPQESDGGSKPIS